MTMPNGGDDRTGQPADSTLPQRRDENQAATQSTIVVEDATEPMTASGRRTWVVLCCSALIAALATLVATHRGPGFSPDSAYYLSAGVNLADGNGLRSFTGQLITVYAPALPAVIAVAVRLGMSAEAGVRILNAAAMAATVVLGFVLLRRHVRSQALLGLSTVLIAVSPPLFHVGHMAWTDLPLVMVCLAFIVVMERWVRDPQGPLMLLGASMLVWVAFMFRYAGITLIPTGIVTVLIAFRTRGWRHSFSKACQFGLLASALPVLWMLRNHSVDGTLMGPRFPSSNDIVITVMRFRDTIGLWILPNPAPVVIQRIGGLLAVTSGIGVTLWFLLFKSGRRFFSLHYSKHSSGHTLVPLTVFIAVYTAYIFVAQLTTNIDPLRTRFMSPIYVPLLIVAVASLERFSTSIFKVGADSLPMALLIAFALFIAGQTYTSARMVQVLATQGDVYTTDTWRSSKLVKVTGELPEHAKVFSNRADAVWLISRRQPVFWPPGPPTRPNVNQGPLNDFVAAVSCSESYLSWFAGTPRDYLFTPEELSAYVRLAVVDSTPQGMLYRLRPLTEPGESC